MNINKTNLKVYFEDERSILTTIWNTSEDMHESDYRSLIEKYCDYLDAYQPANVLIDLNNSKFAIAVDTQEWVKTKIAPYYKKHQTRKIAIVVSDDFIAQLSYEQITREFESKELLIEFFTDVDLATTWLIAGKKPKRE
ncbi:STAS/SEC14 domain-containing protein [Chondrinema litorale]|uniref:STAS/SEC14 domain-containing protein n=1 Tax=Chondrinema litorale TaxID=2994555 RepID=UPI002542E406|nr:STAS/SEC14 domain-containing protein [Chondrinema litorale]UZR93756.1 STAS/SEC14 domain-containing protein [Chondrinema litorale]